MVLYLQEIVSNVSNFKSFKTKFLNDDFLVINGKIHNILESSHVGGNKRRRLNQGGANLNDQDTGDFILRVKINFIYCI